MKTREGELYSGILYNAELENEADIKEYLSDAGINGEKFIAEMKELIRLKLQELLYNQGVEFRNKYLHSLHEDNIFTGINETKLQYAFRNLDKLNEDDLKNIEEDKKKLKILKKLNDGSGN